MSIIKVPEVELSRAVQRGDETVVFSGKSVGLLTGLLFSGHYDHIISRLEVILGWCFDGNHLN